MPDVEKKVLGRMHVSRKKTEICNNLTSELQLAATTYKSYNKHKTMAKPFSLPSGPYFGGYRY